MSTFYRLGRLACTSVFVFFLMLQCAYAAAFGTIVGRVVDRATGDPLPGANVMIQGTSIGVSTDLDGKFSMKNIPTGRQTIRVTYVGYVSAS